MKKSYKVKINQGTENATIVDIPASATQPVKVKAVTAAKYVLVDETTGMAPDNIRAKRIGKDLSISFTGSSATDLLITDYYESTVAGFNALIGEAETGVYHAYMTESGEASSMVPSLSEGGKFVGMALGGEQLATGAAAGALIAASGFNPLLAAPLALWGVEVAVAAAVVIVTQRHLKSPLPSWPAKTIQVSATATASRRTTRLGSWCLPMPMLSAPP
jgi:hypothetical protein